MGTETERWDGSRSLNVTSGVDGKVASEERIYEVPDDEALKWRFLTGKAHPDWDDMFITNVTIKRHALGLNSKITVLYTTAGVEASADGVDWELSITPSATRKRKTVICPKDQEPIEVDIPSTMLTLSITNWVQALPLGTIVPWLDHTNKNEHRIQGQRFMENTLLFLGAPGRRVGNKRWRVTWSWLYNPDGWLTKCREHPNEILYLYPRENFTPVLEKISEVYDV